MKIMKTTDQNGITSIWQGSISTLNHVAQQIEEKFGKDAVAIYDPTKNCFTYNRWKSEGYQVKKGEESLKSVTWITDKETDQKYPKTVCLFFITQVEPIKN